MAKSDFFELKLSESKDLLNNINDSIRETRNRIYFLIAIVFAIFSYCVEDILNSNYFSSKSIILYSVLIFGFYIFYQCRLAITPLKLRFNGISPDNFEKITDKKTSKTKINILYTYQRSIEVNGDHLQMISKAYNRAFYCLIIWLIFVSCLFSFQRIIQCYV
jgi:hypothetical protein